MRRTPVLLCLSLLALLPACLQAQNSGETTAVVPPQYGGVQVHVAGVFVTPIPNIPMTATVDISTMRNLPDGTVDLRKTENHIARASNGSIYNERRMLVGASYKGLPRLLGSHVYNPQTRVSTSWTPYSSVAQSVTLSARQIAERKPFLMPVPNAVDQDLGQSTMSGISVRGLRRTRTLNAQASGSSAPVTIVDEYWYSEDLHLILLEKHDDPRTGEQIVTVLNVQRSEPPAELFLPPKNYQVVDATPTAGNTAEIDPFAAPAPARVPTHTVVVK